MRLIQLMKKKLYPDEMETLFEVGDFTDEILAEHFDIKDGNWYVDGEGWLVGENRKCSAAMCVTKEWYTGDVLVEFDAATVAPATRDINVTFHGSWNEENACKAEDPGLTPGWGRSPGESDGNPLQYSCLDNSMDRGAWWATVHGVTKSWTRLSD